MNDRPTDPKADLRATGPLPGAQVADTLLARALRRAWWTILWERLWPALASLCVAIGVFLAASQFEAAFVSLAHGEGEVTHTLDAVRRAL